MSGSCQRHEIERNDPCPCGSGRKYKKCNVQKCASPSMRKFKATVLSSKSDQLFSKINAPSANAELSTENLAQRIRSSGQIDT